MRSPLTLLNTPALIFCLVLLSLETNRALDRWAALSQLESGDDDLAVGAAGEVSRYQVRPDIWERYATPAMNWQAPADALAVAQKIMKERCAEFEHTFKRSPNDWEFYVLWNAPAQIGRPARAVRERAERFCSLVRRPGGAT